MQNDFDSCLPWKSIIFPFSRWIYWVKRKMPSNMPTMCGFISSCTCAKNPFGHLLFIETFCSIQWFCLRTLKSLITLHGCAGIRCPHMPEDKFSHGAAHIYTLILGHLNFFSYLSLNLIKSILLLVDLSENNAGWVAKSGDFNQTPSDLKKGKRTVQGVPQSQTAALPRPQEEEPTLFARACLSPYLVLRLVY